MRKAKKWALLSNPFDPTLMRNKLVYDLAGKLPFIFSPKSYYVDVWLNDVFIGNYQLTQNIEFNSQTWDYDVDNGDYLIERDEKVISTKDINQHIKYIDWISMIDYYWIEEFVSDPDLKTGSFFSQSMMVFSEAVPFVILIYP